MGTMARSAFTRTASNYDESSMQQSLLFADSLMGLKNLRTQLYSAAEYFELSYMNDDQKQIVVETLKDYAIKALVNTVDHLGSVTCKVNDLLDEKVDELAGAEFRVSCIEQAYFVLGAEDVKLSYDRNYWDWHSIVLIGPSCHLTIIFNSISNQRLRTCQQYIDRGGLDQQWSVIHTPKYHKRYILPAGETMNGAIRTKSKYLGCSLDDEDDWHQFRNAVRATIAETPTPPISKGNSPLPSPRLPQRSATFSFTATTPRKELEKRSASPNRFPLLRSGSVRSTSRSTTPTTRPTTPSSNAGRRYPSEPRKSVSMRLSAEKDHSKDIEQYPSKSKRLLKSLLSRRKSKKDDMLYTYLDEY